MSEATRLKEHHNYGRHLLSKATYTNSVHQLTKNYFGTNFTPRETMPTSYLLISVKKSKGDWKRIQISFICQP
jgi:hypothetical protein